MTSLGATRGKGAFRFTRLLQLLAAVPLAVGIGGLIMSSGAGAQARDSSATTSTSTSTTTTTAAAATNPNTYSLSAQANALDVLLTDPSLPLSGDLQYEVGPYGASASVDSLGESLSDAGAPYAPSIDSLPGTVNGLGAGDVPPLPPLPGYVTASYPSTPTDSETTAGYTIASTAGANTAQGSVKLGVQPGGSPTSTLFASAQTTANGDGSVTVNASAGSDVLDFGQLMDIGNVSSSVSMTQQANQAPVVTSKTNLGTITLLGQTSGLLGASASVAGIGVPITITTGLISTLNELLNKADVTLTYLPETFTYTDGTSSTGSTPNSSKTLQGIDSGALQVTFSKTLPSQGLVTLSATLGRVYVTTTDSPGIGSGEPSGLTIGIGTGTTSLPLPSLLPVVSSLGSSASAPTTPATTSTTPTTTAPTRHTLAAAPAYAVEEGPPTESLYLVLVLGALAMFLGAQAVRYLAVRLSLSGRTK